MNTVPPPLPPTSQLAAPLPAAAALPPGRTRAYLRSSLAVAGLTVGATALTYATGWGVNLPLLIGLVLATAFWRRPAAWRSPSVRVQLLAVAALAIASVVHLDPWTVATFLLASLALFGSIALSPGVDPARGLLGGSLQMLATVGLAAWYQAVRALRPAFNAVGLRGELAPAKAAVPLLIVFGFAALYVASSAVLSTAWSDLLAGTASVAVDLEIGSLAFHLLAWSVPAAGVVYVWRPATQYVRRTLPTYPDLEVENAAAGWTRTSMTLLAVNLAALVVNTVDGLTTWRVDAAASAAELTRGVHAGTSTLITAIVLASGYLLATAYEPPADRTRARLLSLAWLGQNIVMAITVATRNFQYTEAYGLTYKRLGVWAFLTCATAGLILLGRELRLRRGLEDLVRRQAWIVYAALTVLALPDWPALITRYNLSEARRTVDHYYLSTLRPYNLAAWSEYDPTVMGDPTRNTDLPQTIPWWTEPAKDWRAWDLGQARRARVARR